jgi:hypothetical protein
VRCLHILIDVLDKFIISDWQRTFQLFNDVAILLGCGRSPLWNNLKVYTADEAMKVISERVVSGVDDNGAILSN